MGVIQQNVNQLLTMGIAGVALGKKGITESYEKLKANKEAEANATLQNKTNITKPIDVKYTLPEDNIVAISKAKGDVAGDVDRAVTQSVIEQTASDEGLAFTDEAKDEMFYRLGEQFDPLDSSTPIWMSQDENGRTVVRTGESATKARQEALDKQNKGNSIKRFLNNLMDLNLPVDKNPAITPTPSLEASRRLLRAIFDVNPKDVALTQAQSAMKGAIEERLDVVGENSVMKRNLNMLKNINRGEDK